MSTIWIGVIEQEGEHCTVDASCRFVACKTREGVAEKLAESATQLASACVETIPECQDVYATAYASILTAGYVEGDDLPVQLKYNFHAYELDVE